MKATMQSWLALGALPLAGMVWVQSLQFSGAQDLGAVITAARAQAAAEPVTNKSLPLFTFDVGAPGGNFWMLGTDTPPLPFNPFPELPVFSLGGDEWLVDDRSVDYPGLQASFAETFGWMSMNFGEDEESAGYDYTTNDLWLEITGYTNCTAALVIHRPGNDTNAFHDLFYTTNLAAPINWQFVQRCVATNVVVSDLGDAQGFFRLGQTNGTLSVTTNRTPLELAQLLVPPWATVYNATNIGVLVARGTFAGGHGCGLPIETGAILSTGYITNAIGPNNDDGSWAASHGSTLGTDGDTDLSHLVEEGPTLDAAVLEFDLVSSNSFVLQFQYVFASEEYPEYIGSLPTGFNDPMAIFVSTNYDGTNWIIDATNNIALVPSTNQHVSVNTINGGGTNALPPYIYVPPINPQYYVDNGDPIYSTNMPVFNVQYDGTTVRLTAQAYVSTGVTNHIKIGIADYAGSISDRIYDSAVFIKAWSSGSCCQCP